MDGQRTPNLQLRTCALERLRRLPVHSVFVREDERRRSGVVMNTLCTGPSQDQVTAAERQNRGARSVAKFGFSRRAAPYRREGVLQIKKALSTDHRMYVLSTILYM